MGKTAFEWSQRQHTGKRTPEAEAHLAHDQLTTCDASVVHESPSRLAGIVVRHPDGTRGQPKHVLVTCDDGLKGDRWSVGKRSRTNQISMMNVHVAHTIANGQSVVLFGDNLFVDLDLSEAAMPVGTHLTIGEVRFEVSEEPHTPCHQFKARFGDAAFRLTARDLRLRGVLLTVLSDGMLEAGALIQVRRA